MSYKFEGYNIYQGSTVAGPWTRIATYDLVNGIATISDAIFDLNLGDIIVAPVQFGEDAGVRHTIEITTDAVRGGGLHNATAYYYSVTSTATTRRTPRTLANAQGTAGQDLNALIVYPQGPVAGVDLSVAGVDSITAERFDTNLPPTTDVVTADVVDKTKVTGCDYQVYYTDALPFPVFNGTEVHPTGTCARLPDGPDADAVPTPRSS